MTNDEYNNNSAFCPLPWGSIYVETDGRVDNCCISRNNLGNLHQTKLTDIISGARNIQIKQEMLAGKRAGGCSNCYPPQDDLSERTYLRNSQLRDFSNWEPDRTLFDSVDNFKLSYADLRFRNTCNYGCVYCSPTLSSTIASELKQFVSIDESAIEDVTKYFVDNAASLKKIYMAGGEPMLIKENQAILEKLLEVNPNCHFIVNTNLSMIRNNRIFDLLTKFKNVEWLISVDDMGEKYNYIRYPGNWEQFASNLDYLKTTIPDTHTVKFNMVYLALNAKTMFDCVDFLLENNYAQKPEHINLAYVNNGHQFIWCDPRALPESYLDEVRAVIDTRKPTGSRLDDDIRYLRECLDVPVVKDSYHDLFVHLDTLDKRRKIDSQKVFSDIYASRQ